MRLPRCSSSPRSRAIGLAWRPAPQTSVCASSTFPDLSVTRVGSTDSTISPRRTSTPNFSSSFLVYSRSFSLNIPKSCGEASTSVIRACSFEHVRVVLGEGVVVQLGQRAGALHPGGAAADDDDVQRAVLGERVVLVRGLPLLQHVVLQTDGVGERVHRERVLRSAGGAEEVDLGAEPEHEVVVGQRLHLRELDLTACEVDAGHGVDVDAGVLLVVEEVAQRVPHLCRLQQRGCDLVEQRLEGVVVVLVHDHDLHVRLLQRARRTHAREATAENQDARSRRLLVICHFRHLQSLQPRQATSTEHHPGGMIPVPRERWRSAAGRAPRSSLRRSATCRRHDRSRRARSRSRRSRRSAAGRWR